jgi:hypothetical protein
VTRATVAKPEAFNMSRDQQPSATGRAFRIGLMVSACSVLVMLAPLLINLGKGSKYFVAPAFIGMCLGLCILLNAAIDWMRGK